MHRRRYHLRRFLPKNSQFELEDIFSIALEEPQVENKEEEEPFENLFSNVEDQLLPLDVSECLENLLVIVVYPLSMHWRGYA